MKFAPRLLLLLPPLLGAAFFAACSTQRLMLLDQATHSQSGVLRPEQTGSSLLPLSQILRSEMSGLQSEGAESQQKILDDARLYARFKSRRATVQERSRWAALCQLGRADTDLCADSMDHSRHGTETKKHRTLRTMSSASIRQAFLRARIDLLARAGEGELNGALKKIEASRIYPALNAIDQIPGCPSVALLTSLGMKLENLMPDPMATARALEMYQRASDCGSDVSAMRARYRAALLLLSLGRWEDADRHLAVLVDSPNGDEFRSRALYWRYRCAVAMKKSDHAELAKNALIKDYPLSLHGLLLSGRDPASWTTDPLVRMRSVARPALNARIRAIEAAQSVGATEGTLDLIESVMKDSAGVEPELELYFAVLLRRAGDTSKKFSLLTALLRDHPELLSQQSLEMLYPKNQFDLVADHSNLADPYVLLSLMRQESAFNTHARSKAGAMGLMQVMPSTARRVDRHVSRGGLMDPATNVRIGAKYFSVLLNRYSGDVELALAAYNAGPDRVDEWVKRYAFSDRILFLDSLPFRETRDYVASIARNYYWYLKLYETQAFEDRIQSRRVPASFAVFR